MDNNDYKELLEKIGAVIESIGKLTTRISVMESKLEQLFDLRDEVKDQGERIIKIEKDLNNEFEKVRQLEKLNDENKKRNEDNKKWIMGILATVVGGIALAVVKLFIGL